MLYKRFRSHAHAVSSLDCLPPKHIGMLATTAQRSLCCLRSLRINFRLLVRPCTTMSAQPEVVPFSRSFDTYTRTAAASRKTESPAAERNKQFILEVLQSKLSPDTQGVILEVASGSGQHVAHFAPRFPQAVFQPSDLTSELFDSITAYVEEGQLQNVHLPPLVLDAGQPPESWPIPRSASSSSSAGDGKGSLAGMIAINITHISPWEVTQGLLRGAAHYLGQGSRLFLYGPFKRDGEHTSEGNASFDESLRARNPAWGYRDIGDIKAEGEACGLTLEEAVPMPANNFTLIFIKQ